MISDKAFFHVNYKAYIGVGTPNSGVRVKGNMSESEVG